MLAIYLRLNFPFEGTSSLGKLGITMLCWCFHVRMIVLIFHNSFYTPKSQEDIRRHLSGTVQDPYHARPRNAVSNLPAHARPVSWRCMDAQTGPYLFSGAWKMCPKFCRTAAKHQPIRFQWLVDAQRRDWF